MSYYSLLGSSAVVPSSSRIRPLYSTRRRQGSSKNSASSATMDNVQDDDMEMMTTNYGGFSVSGDGGDCCPLVVDSFVVIGLIALIAAATAFLNIAITMNIMGRRKRGLNEDVNNGREMGETRL